MNTFLGLLIMAAIFVLYWTPTAVAGLRHVPNIGSVVVINFLTGWSVIGWIIALALACRSIPAAAPQPPAWPYAGQAGRRIPALAAPYRRRPPDLPIRGAPFFALPCAWTSWADLIGSPAGGFGFNLL